MQLTEKRKSPLTSIATAVLDPYAANFWLQKINPLWSVNQSLGKIVKKDTAAQGVVSFTLQFNKKFQIGAAGQHHPVYVTIQGVRYERTYSLTQLDAQHVLLTVKKVDQGKVSTWLVEQAKVGDTLEFGAPYGDMQLPAQAQPLILLAAGSGITPMYSLVQDMAKSGRLSSTPVTLMYWVKTFADAAFKAQFEAWAQQYPNFKFQVLYTQEPSLAHSRLNAEHLQDLTQIEQSAVFACGPSGFTTQVEQLFAQAALLKTEAFSMTPVLSDDVGLVQVTLTQSKKIVTIPKGKSILESLEQQNIKPKYGCRMGICHKCVCNKAEGATKNLVDGVQNSEPNNQLKICVNSAQTDLIIDL